ncbi:MAG: hypothetical protein A3F85_02840 [Candidatus Ryanbacteria bacterium RIFCSPLOWO2_12_FULL_44_26]|nr:MAG: hypothetical protein A3F85_02840 [Candidatus Ryanbacteria bacterium RIFCSPLOWO2_12_FULL_44_26]
MFAVIVIGGFFIFQKYGGNLQGGYEEIYTLVPDKISQSAAIVVRLPEGIKFNVAEASTKVTFEPAVAGDWRAGNKDDELVYQPKEKLELGKYYTVILATNEIRLEKDFLADEDPKVISIFPAGGSEASEYSEITIIFNRPMVPLTALDVLSEENIPVEIHPTTPGKFKWITTRDLQFIPESRLQRSSHYTVRVKSGFVSTDGLSVNEKEYAFITWPLRYEGEIPQNHNSSKTLYNEPIRIVFNQPINIERTKGELTLKRGNDRVNFIASYGSRFVHDDASGKRIRKLDKSILEIYNEADQHGRKQFWDFNTGYTYTLKKAYPLEGDIDLNQVRAGAMQTTDIIDTVSAESPRTQFAESDLFDPQGKIWVSFFEDIDKDASFISADHISSIEYGEKCREPDAGEEVSYGSNCEKVPDRKRVSIKFDESKLQRGQSISIEFKRIYNTAGLQLNAETITRTVKTFPDLVIYKTSPESGAQGADLKALKVCTSNPLTVPDEEVFYERVKSNVTIGLWNWYGPYRVREKTSEVACEVGQFENTILYGLVPEFPYEITLNLLDDFGQSISRKVSFTSGKLTSFDRTFYQMQGMYNITSPGRTKLTFASDNLEYVNLHICEVSPEVMLSYIEDRPEITSPPSTLNCINTIQDRINLPRKYWSRSYFQVNLKNYIGDSLGHYVLTFSHPDYRRVHRIWNAQERKYEERVDQALYEKSYLSITHLAVQEKKIERRDFGSASASKDVLTNVLLSQTPQNLYWVSEIGSLAPVAGAQVTLYRKNQEAVGSYFTGNDGIALTNTFDNLMAAIVRKGGDSAIVASSYDKLQYASTAQAAERTYLYTDRPIYRPGHQVFIKGIFRLGYDDEYEIYRGKKAEIEIRNSKYETVSKQSVDVSEYGTFTANFTLDANAPLGTYSISALGGYVSFDVEEYVPAAFNVEAKTNQEEYVAGDTAHIAVNAEYFFGVPVESGTVEYSLSSQDFFFDRYRDQYFRFGNPWYYGFDGYYGDTYILRGSVPLGTDGSASLEQKLDFEKLFKEEESVRSKIFTLNVTVRNRNGQSISTQKSFIVHRGGHYTGINLDRSFLGQNESTTARIKTVDVKGAPISVGGLELEIKKVTWESFKRREVDGNYYYRTEQKKETVKKTTLRTNGNGDASYEFSLETPGEYEVFVAGNDDRGNRVVATYDLYVSGRGSVSIRPTNNETLELATNKAEVNVGDQVKIIIKSPYERAKALVTLERGKVFHYEIISIVNNLTEYVFQVKDEHIPNVFGSVLLLSPEPEIKHNQIQYQVNTKEREIDINVQSNKNSYLPGETVELNVETKDKFGRSLETEVSLAVVDMSVLALKGNPKKNPVLFFYRGTPLTVSTASNIKNILHEVDIPTGTKGGSGGGEDPAKKKRGVFKDTAYWEGIVRTDTSGRARVSFILPDNLTTWQIESVGITKDSKVGVGYREFKAQKEVTVVPLRPRFIVPGDAFFIGAQVFNETENRQKLDVSLEGGGLILTGKKELSITLNAHDSMTVYFPVEAPQAVQDGSHTFIVSAKNSDYEDTVENSISITRNNTYESVATAAYTDVATTREYIYLPPNVIPDRGGLEVKTSATLAVFLSDALNYLVEYPYGCSEQIASKLSALGILRRGLSLKNIGDAFTLDNVTFEGQTYSPDDVVRIGLARLYENQSSDGGFSYYKGMPSNYYLTLHVVTALVDLKEAGYDIDASRIDRAGTFLRGQLRQKNELRDNNDLVILSDYTLSRIYGHNYDGEIRNKTLTLARNQQYVSEKASNTSLTYLALILSGSASQDLANNVFTALENKLVIDSRGASIRPNVANTLYQFYETPVKDTALYLKALAVDERDNPVIDKVLRWILRSRAKDGAWGSTNNTIAVVDAFTDFLLWKQETESEFDLNLSLDTNPQATFTFKKDSIFKTFTKFISTQDLGLGKLRSFTLTKTNKNEMPNNYYYDILLKYYLPVENIPPRDEGFSVTREFYRVDDEERETPILEATQGDMLRVRLVIATPHQRNFVSIEDYIPAGMEIVNLSLATEDQSLQSEFPGNDYYYDNYYNDDYYEGGVGMLSNPGLANIWSSFRRFFRLDGPAVSPAVEGELEDDFYGRQVKIVSPLYPDADELHDDRAFLFKERLAPGVYEYEYFVRALVPGTFHHLPAVASEMYFPENFGRTRGELFTVKEAR